jgi:hypothetical protein
MTIPNRLTLDIVRLPPLSLLLNVLPVPLKAIARGFFVLFHISIGRYYFLYSKISNYSL